MIHLCLIYGTTYFKYFKYVNTIAVNGSLPSFYRISYSSDIEIKPETFLTSAHHSFQIHTFILTSQFHTKLHTGIIRSESKGEAKYTLRVTLMLLFCILGGGETEVAHFLRKSIMTTNFTALHELVHLYTSK